MILVDTNVISEPMQQAPIQDAQLAVLPDTTHLTITRRPEWLVPMIENRISSASE